MSPDTSKDRHAGNRRAVAEIVKPDPIHPQARATEVIDTDFHFQPPFETLRQYFDEPFRSNVLRYPQVASEYSPDAAIGKVALSSWRTLGRLAPKASRSRLTLTTTYWS